MNEKYFYMKLYTPQSSSGYGGDISFYLFIFEKTMEAQIIKKNFFLSVTYKENEGMGWTWLRGIKLDFE